MKKKHRQSSETWITNQYCSIKTSAGKCEQDLVCDNHNTSRGISSLYLSDELSATGHYWSTEQIKQTECTKDGKDLFLTPKVNDADSLKAGLFFKRVGKSLQINLNIRFENLTQSLKIIYRKKLARFIV